MMGGPHVQRQVLLHHILMLVVHTRLQQVVAWQQHMCQGRLLPSLLRVKRVPMLWQLGRLVQCWQQALLHQHPRSVLHLKQQQVQQCLLGSVHTPGTAQMLQGMEGEVAGQLPVACC
jgi:hypothetical protein